ncbi:cytochrome b [Frateuria sp.]|uniref:cytochrome b n=1 Tax=Frateuria sp. TaxID=2211372 RepID=UPI003F7E8CEA
MAAADSKADKDSGGIAGLSPSARGATIPVTARPRALIASHWLTVLFLVLAAAVILARSGIDARAWRNGLLDVHRHLGLCVLLLFGVRIALRFRWGPLPDLANAHRTHRAAAGLAHAALYATLLALPLLGWALSDAQGKRVHFLGLSLPRLVEPDFDLADQLLVWHQDAAWVLLALALLHASAALWHHFVLRDAVLRGMWPKR